MNSRRFFGYIKICDICIAEKEKAIIDSLLFPKYVDIAEVCKSIENVKDEISLEKLIDYCMRMKNFSLNKRLGYFLEVLKIKLPKNLNEKLEKKYK